MRWARVFPLALLVSAAREWGTADGLPQNSVTSIAQTACGGVLHLVVFARNSRTLLFDQLRIVRITVN
jgi:hypothetical protein